MSPTNLAEIREGLARERNTLTAAASQARQELQMIEGDLRKVETAIAALDGVDAKGQKEKSPSQRRPAPTLPAAGRSEITKLIALVLTKTGGLPVDDLKRRVEELASQQGFTRRGIALRMKEALTDPEFVHGVDGVALRRVAIPLTRAEQEATRT